ncbi:MAG: diacylglycerol kinase family protein [Candidatus Heimdallarchaeota archaeon]
MDSEMFLIINPNAKSGKTGKKLSKILPVIKEYLGDIEFEITKGPQEEISIAKKAIERGYKTLLSLGGDGTASNIGDVLVENPEVKLGIISGGSMNDWGRTHSIPINLEKNLEVILECYSETFPALKCSGDKTLYAFDHIDGGFVAEAGAAAQHEAKWIKNGFLKYTYLALKYVIKFKNVPVKIQIDDKELIEVDDFSASVFGFSDSIAGFRILPGNSYYSRKNKDIGFVFARGLKGIQRLQLLLKTSSGKHVNMKGVWLARGKTITIESARPLAWEAEGEIFNKTKTKVNISYEDNALNLIVPRDREYIDDFDENFYYKDFRALEKK